MTCSDASHDCAAHGGAATAAARPADAATAHPLDPLRPDEIEAAAAIVRRARGLGEAVRFISISPREPRKGEDSATARRAAEVVLRDGASRRTVEALVDLTAGELRDWRELEGVQAQLTADEFLAVEAAVRAAPEFIAALRRR